MARYTAYSLDYSIDYTGSLGLLKCGSGHGLRWVFFETSAGDTNYEGADDMPAQG